MSSWKVCFYFQAHQLNCQTNIYGYTHKHSHSLTLYISLSHTHNERKVMTGVSFLAMATCALLSYRCVLAILPCFIIGFFLSLASVLHIHPDTTKATLFSSACVARLSSTTSFLTPMMSRYFITRTSTPVSPFYLFIYTHTYFFHCTYL